MNEEICHVFFCGKIATQFVYWFGSSGIKNGYCAYCQRHKLPEISYLHKDISKEEYMIGTIMLS
jgi:hypothetical protein